MSPVFALPWAAAAASILWATYYASCLYSNYLKARAIGLPLKIIPVDHVNPLWLLVDKWIVSVVKRLPGRLGDNTFTRYNYRGWHEDDGLRSHDEMGDAFVLVTPAQNWLYLADPNALLNMYKRGRDFPRWVEITKMLDVFGGPNIATATGERWKLHRKSVNSCLTEQCHAVVWSQGIRLGEEMARDWASKRLFTSLGEDARALSLNILGKACFGQSFECEDDGQNQKTGTDFSFRISLLTVMESALFILALGTKFFTNPPIPLPAGWKRVGHACSQFQGYMTKLYQKELKASKNGESGRDHTLMASLIRSSKKDGEKGLSETEIYGTMFVVSFAGHDTTAHLVAFALFYLAANPLVQEWLSEELNRVLGDRPPSEWDYHADFPRLKRCLAILYETLRVKTPAAEVKWTADKTQSLRVGEKELNLPPGTLIIPSYIYVQRHPKYWGTDGLEWKPQRWVAKADTNITAVDKDNEILLQPPSRGNYLGWSEGTRDCPAKRFSQVEWVAIMASLFRDWKIEPQRLQNETLPEASARVMRFIDENTEYGGLLLQLMHPERVPMVWSRRRGGH